MFDGVIKDFKDQIANKIRTQFEPIERDMENLLAARSRWKSDDMLKQQKVVSRFDAIENDFVKLKDFVDLCLSPLTVCLLEGQSLQVQVDAQEELDR